VRENSIIKILLNCPTRQSGVQVGGKVYLAGCSAARLPGVQPSSLECRWVGGSPWQVVALHASLVGWTIQEELTISKFKKIYKFVIVAGY